VSRDYSRLLGASAGAAGLAVAAKLSALVTVANLHGAALRVGLAWGWFPYLDVIADRATFASIVALSTAAMAAVAAFRLFPLALRGGADPDLVSGRLVGVAVAAETLGLEYARHLLHGPVLAWPAAALALGAIGVGVASATVAALRSAASGPMERAGAAHPSGLPEPTPARLAPRAQDAPLVPTAMLSLPPDPFTWDRREPESGLEEEAAAIADSILSD
jgi:hypothetical protein